jgi:hypothetical protein
MKLTCIRILAFATVATLPLLAQQPSPSPQPATGSPQATTPQNGAPAAQPVPSSPEAANLQLRPITAELVDKLDTKSAKAGDAVVMKTTQQATTASGVEIPKGSKITGHVVDVAPQGQGGDNSRLTIQFDQAEIKGGQNLPIRSVIQSVAPAGTSAAPEATGGSAATTPSSGSAAGNGQSTSSTGATSPSQPASGGVEPAGGTPAPGTVVATKGNLAIRTTSIPGILLIGNVTGQPFSNAAGALLGAKQDVHLDGGTVMVVAIVAAPPTVGGR